MIDIIMTSLQHHDGHCARSPINLQAKLSELLFSGALNLTILRGRSNTPAICKMGPFYSNNYLLQVVDYSSEFLH